MFVIANSQSYSWPVVLEYPVSGGKYEKHTFDVEFKRLSQSRIKEIRDDIVSEKIKSDIEVAKEIVTGWKGIVDAKSEPIPFSESALDEVLNFPRAASSIVEAFFDSIAGGKRKN